MSDLKERLRKVESGPTRHPGVATNWYRNPDGPEAAEEIERLRGDLSESKIKVANLDMRLRHRVAEANDLEDEIGRLATVAERLREKADKYDWLHDSIEHFGEGRFIINLGGIEPDSETDETIFDWLVGQAMKNEKRK